MMEKPILFNTSMVQAILKGNKTSTRRPMKPQPLDCTDKVMDHKMNLKSFFEDEPNEFACTWCGNGVGMDGHSKFKAPYAKGDTLYVRETWCDVKKDFKPEKDMDIGKCEYVFKVDDNGEKHTCIDICVSRWRPSIHMPKKVARIFLKVTNVRVERLQDITEDGAKTEGIGLEEATACDGWTFSDFESKDPNYKEAFKDLWDSIYKNWNENPWVWIIEFEKIEGR